VFKAPDVAMNPDDFVVKQVFYTSKDGTKLNKQNVFDDFIAAAEYLIAEGYTIQKSSPYHNIREGAEYPAIMVTTADTDDRVVPGHSFKYTAALQEAQGGDDPVLIRIETRAAHVAGVPTDKVIEGYSENWSFLLHNLEMDLREGFGGEEET
jgi:prolyl oligopeptidase PreP (S9A serine peptidase family)